MAQVGVRGAVGDIEMASHLQSYPLAQPAFLTITVSHSCLRSENVAKFRRIAARPRFFATFSSEPRDRSYGRIFDAPMSAFSDNSRRQLSVLGFHGAIDRIQNDVPAHAGNAPFIASANPPSRYERWR